MNTQPMNSLNDFTDISPEMKAFITDMLNIARNQFLESQELAPMLFVLRDDKQLDAVTLAGMPKDAATRLINTLRSVAPVVFMCEAWTTRCTANPNGAIAQAIRSGEPAVLPEPRLDPNRREVVMVQYFNRERRLLASALITRTPGSPPTLEPWQFCGEVYAQNWSDPNARLASGIIQ